MDKLFKLFLIFLVVIFAKTTTAQVIINEYSCANTTSSGYPDFFGNMDDWVELYNPTSSAIDLNGYYLSDKANKPMKFQIPNSIAIPAGGYVMVFASGRAAIAGGTEIHTNFKLTQTKFEKIILSSPNGTIIDSLTIVPTQLLHSRGRTTDGASTWSLFTNPTPKSVNTGAKLEYAKKPTLSVSAGFYTSPQTVSITTPDPNITIYYTIDGSTPTTSSTIYTGLINIASTTVLRARCFSSTPNIPPSFIETNTYFINDTHTVPVVSICGNNIAGLLNDTDPNAYTGNFVGAIEFFDRSGVMQTEATGDFNKHGNDSWAYGQRGVDFITRDQYGYNYALKYKLFTNKSRKKFQRIILKAGASDNYPFEGQANANYSGELGGAHIRDAFVHVLAQSGNLHLDERTYDACILYVNGQYWGVYETREKVDDPDFLDYYYGQDEQYKNSPNYIQYLATWGGTNMEYGSPNALTDWNTLLNYITTNNMAIQTNFDYVTSQYKWKSLVDYMVLNSYIVNHDMLNWNTSWWRGLDTTGSKTKWRYSLWDMDATFNHYVNYTNIPSTGANTDPCQIDNLPNPGNQGHTVILNALMANPGFKQYYVSRYIDLSNTTFSCANMITILDSLINIITPEMPRQITRWGGTMSEWQQNVQDLRTFINNRCVALNQGLVNCYNVTGPYPLKINVTPAGAGNVKINSITPSSYVYTGNYFGNIDVLLQAKANTAYAFDYWEIVNHTLDSALTNQKNSLQITQTDSIVAHFIAVGDTFSIQYKVSPPYAGEVAINANSSIITTTNILTQFYISGTNVQLTETPLSNLVFDHWEAGAHTILPTITDQTVSFTVSANDVITAVYFEKAIADVPTAFSPNQDGNNDILYVYGGQMEKLYFNIYDRWGELIFSTTTKDKGWDGNFNGKKASTGVYVYKLKVFFKDGSVINKAGNITLIR